MNSPLRARDLFEFSPRRLGRGHRAGTNSSPVPPTPTFTTSLRTRVGRAGTQPTARADDFFQQPVVSLTYAAAANFQPRWAVLVRRQHSLRLRRRDLPRPRFRSCTP
jgi:hypothetical protein